MQLLRAPPQPSVLGSWGSVQHCSKPNLCVPMGGLGPANKPDRGFTRRCVSAPALPAQDSSASPALPPALARHNPHTDVWCQLLPRCDVPLLDVGHDPVQELATDGVVRVWSVRVGGYLQGSGWYVREAEPAQGSLPGERRAGARCAATLSRLTRVYSTPGLALICTCGVFAACRAWQASRIDWEPR